MNKVTQWFTATQSVRTKVVHAVCAGALMVNLLPISLLAAPAEPSPPSPHAIYLPMIVGADTTEQSLAARPVLKIRRLQYQVGKSYQYDYQVVIDTTTAKRDAKGVRNDGSEQTLIHAIADITITDLVYGANLPNGGVDDLFSGEVSLHDVTFTRNDGVNSYTMDDPETLAALKTPLHFKQTSHGQIVEVAAPVDAPAQAVNLQKGVLNALQVTIKESESQYGAAESAGQGEVQAHYTLQDQMDGLHISKQYGKADFVNLIAAGPQNPELQMQNQINLVLDRQRGVITAVTYGEQIASSDGQIDSDNSAQGFDGVTAWSEVHSSGKMTLLTISDATLNAAAVNVAYQRDGLGATLTETYPNQAAIELSSVDLEQELAAFEAEPGNPAHHARLLQLVAADPEDPNDRIDVMGAIAAHLQANTGNDAVAAAYVDVLGSVATPQAQELLSDVLGAPVGPLAGKHFSDVAKEQALINLLTVTSPTDAAINAVRDLAGAAGNPLQAMAVGVLGAVANQVSDENLATAQALTAQLESTLVKSSAAEDIELYLSALGNAGQSSSLRVISPYVVAQTPISGTKQLTNAVAIQMAALVALSHISGNDAEAVVVNAINDTSRPYPMRAMLADALSEREQLSATGLSAVQRFQNVPMAAPGSYSQSWTKLLGNNNLGVEFPGGIEVASPPAQSGIYAYAHQSANAWILNHSLPVVKGELKSFRNGNYQVFGAYIRVAGYLIKKWEAQFQCADSKTGNLVSFTQQFLNVTYTIPVFAVITLNINITATGNFSLDWNYGIDVCLLNKATLNAGIIPHAWATAAASAYLDIVVARGGATLTATLLDTTIPASASLVWDATTTTPRLNFCIDIKAITHPLSGHLDAWADLRVPRWGIPPWEWRRIGQATLWQFSVPDVSYNLFVRCF